MIIKPNRPGDMLVAGAEHWMKERHEPSRVRRLMNVDAESSRLGRTAKRFKIA
jgi:hypothetical protein